MAEWSTKILNFNNLVETYCVDEKASEEIVFDILQDLFSEDIDEATRLHLLLLLQQYEDELVENIDKAVQICGSLLNVYEFLSNEVVLLKTQVLVTVTGICVDFNLVDEAESFYNDFISILIGNVMKLNSGHPLLRKISSDCLRVFEEDKPGLLFTYAQNLLACSKDEKSFAGYSHVLVCASIIYNFFEKSQGAKDMLGTEGTNIDLHKSVSYLIKGMTNLSTAGLIYVLRKVIPCLHRSKISKSVINNLLLYCLPSWKLSHVYIYIFFQRNYQFVFHSMDDSHVTPAIFHLTLLLDINQLTHLQTLIVQYWIAEYVQAIHSSLIYTEACVLTTQALEPNIYTQLHSFPGKATSLLKILKRNSSLLMSFEKQTSILRVLISHSKHMHWYDRISDLFCTLYRLYEYGSSNVQEDIIDLVEKLTVGSLKLAMHTIDFCDHIERLQLNNASFNLLSNIVKGLISLDKKEILPDLKSFFLILEKVVTVKEICPLHIIECLKEIVKDIYHKESSMQDGNLLLSICRNLMINYNDEGIRYEIASLLWYISQNFHSRYIHDRATAYYMIIGRMAPKHYRAIFSSALLNQQPNKVNGDVAEVMTEGSLLVKKWKKNFLALTWKEQVIKDSSDINLNGLPLENILDAYHNSLVSGVLNRSLTHKFILSMTSDPPHNIYAIQLDLCTTGPFETRSVSCSHLHKNQSDEARKEEELTICFEPKCAKVATFQVRATFIDEKNNSWITNLDPFDLQFKHLFKPLQCEPTDRTRLFHLLWDSFETNENTAHTPSISVKNIGVVTASTVYNELQKFVVTQSESSIDLGIYLPPTNHILLRFRFHTVDTIVRIGVDDISLLDEVDKYLDSFHPPSH